MLPMTPEREKFCRELAHYAGMRIPNGPIAGEFMRGDPDLVKAVHLILDKVADMQARGAAIIG